VDRGDRQAYLEEQIERQKRGEAIDVEWVKAELERVRQQQTATLAGMQRRLRLLVVIGAVVLAVLWVKNGGLSGTGGVVMLALVLVALLAAWGLGRSRSR
jgi:Flp pilus assembly protein TadB